MVDYKDRKWNPANKGKGKGSINKKGYRTIWINGKNVKEHRFIMEQHIGRPLLPTEDVHHINVIKTDNRIENLQLLAKPEHTRISNSERVYKSGYKMKLTDEERKRRAERMNNCRQVKLNRLNALTGTELNYKP